MTTQELIAGIDEEISRLRQVRALLSGAGQLSQVSVAQLAGAVQRRGPGRPKGSVSQPTGPAKRRTMSPEGRARIAAAQRARWAKQNGAAERKEGAAAGGSKAALKKAAAGDGSATKPGRRANAAAAKGVKKRGRPPGKKAVAGTTAMKKAAGKRGAATLPRRKTPGKVASKRAVPSKKTTAARGAEETSRASTQLGTEIAASGVETKE